MKLHVAKLLMIKDNLPMKDLADPIILRNQADNISV